MGDGWAAATLAGAETPVADSDVAWPTGDACVEAKPAAVVMGSDSGRNGLAPGSWP